MKIAIFSPYNIFKGGGVQEHVNYQAELLRKKGHHVDIITPRPRRRQHSELPKNHIFLGTSTRIRTPSATSADVSISVDNEAIDAVLDNDYDVIHLHEPLVPLAARQILSRAQNTKALLIGTFHAALPGNLLGKPLVSTYRNYAKSIVPQLDVVTAVSPAAIGFIGDYINSDSINYIPNGVQTNLYRYNAEPREDSILFLGRLEKRKGARYTLKAFQELQKNRPDVRLDIAGDGPLRKSLQQYVRDNDIQNVHFHGFVEEQKKLDLLSSCGVYTSPALYGESFGIVLAEAMASGAPTVAHPNDGYSWVLKDTGRLSLVNCKDSAAYAARLQLLLEDSELRKVWQSWAKKYVQQFDYSKVVDKYEKLYKTALKAKRSK